MDSKLALFSLCAGVGLSIGFKLILRSEALIGLFIFLLGLWNLYLMFKQLGMDELKAKEFSSAYPGLFLLILCMYLLNESGLSEEKPVLFFVSLFLIYAGFDARKRRFKAK